MRRRRTLLLLAILAAAATFASSRELRETPLPAAVRSQAQFTAFIDGLVPRWQVQHRVPGVCVGIVAEDAGDLRCYGKTRAGGGRPIDGRSRFAVASVSKAFTALAVLTLAAKENIGLDDPVERHLRTWRFPAGPFDGSRVTVRQLLTHTAAAGVSSYGGAVSLAVNETTRDVIEGRGPGRERVTLVAPPGSGFRYSGGGYMVLQLLIEDVSGMPFESFVQENVFEPLGMRDSSFSWRTPRDTDAAGHDVAGRPLALHAYGAAMAPGGMVTTGDDMLAFVSAVADSRVASLLGWPGGVWEQYADAARPGYGMGIVVGQANGHVLIGHAGTTMGYDAGFTGIPAERVGWFVLENGNGGVFLKSDLDRLFMEWKTGTIDPRYRVLRVLGATVSFLAIALPGLGLLALASFAASFTGRRRRWLGASGAGRLSIALRLAAGLLLAGFLASWITLFHTEAFYPAFTTAWLPFAFRYVTVGVALLVLRAALSCVLVRERCPLDAAAWSAPGPFDAAGGPAVISR